MIEELRSLIAGEVISQCHRCQIDHPSQKHDLCLFKTRQEHTEMFIESHDGIKPLQHHRKMVS